MTDLAHVVRAAQDGSRPAFAQLYADFARMVHGILLSRVARDDVDDLVQDVFLIAMERLKTLRDPEAFGGWLATLARHHAVDHLRRHARAEQPMDDLAIARLEGHARTGAVIGPAIRNVAVDTRAEAVRVLSVIRALPEAYREPLVLRLVEGMTGPEIAARTGLTPASVRVNLHRGMKLLRERLGVSV